VKKQDCKGKKLSRWAERPRNWVVWESSLVAGNCKKNPEKLWDLDMQSVQNIFVSCSPTLQMS